MSLWLAIGALIGLMAITIIYRKDIFRKKVKPYQPATSTYKYNMIQRVSSTPLEDEYKRLYIPVLKIQNKKKDLQDQLIRHENEPGFELAPRDAIRYEAMIEILDSILEE